MFVAQVLNQDRSCQNIVNQAVAKSLINGVTGTSTHTGGYCKARQRLPLEMVRALALFTLYKRRWEIETNFGQIKTILGMNILSCKTPAMIIKEIWVYILAYNLIRLLMAQSSVMMGLRPVDISFKHCLQLWLNYLQQTATMDSSAFKSLPILMAQQRVARRPGSIEPRALKRRPKAYPMLMKPRAEAREMVRANGHPKKLK